MWVPTGNGLFIAYRGLVLLYFGDNLSPIFPVLGCIFASRALNMLLSILAITLPDKKNSLAQMLIGMLSIIVTDKEYDAPYFENELFRIKEICNAPSSCIAEIVNNPHAINTLDDGTSLSIPSYREGGALDACASWRARFRFLPVKMPVSKLVRIEMKCPNFKLIPVLGPFSIILYSLYQWFVIIRGYRGAQDIIKCLVWLALVSFLTELIIDSFPGLCLVINTIYNDDSESLFICVNSESQTEKWME